jgi:glycolate oxidase FAD binding subunit
MADRLQPRDGKDVEAAVQWALAEGKALELVGHGSKRAIGRPAQTDLTLDLSALNGVTLYEPEELVLSARAGTPLADIEALVEANDQQLAFEPMDYGPLLGEGHGRGTIGAALAMNLCGPRRIKAGAARDHFLGFTAVSGRGETFKSGGRVVKNVTGYDLCKLVAGSWGTLAAMTDVTIKTLPRPETELSVLVRLEGAAQATDAMGHAMGSSSDVSGAAFLPAGIAARMMPGGGADAADSLVALRLEGFAPSLVERRQVLERLMKPFGDLHVLDARLSRELWRRVRDAVPFAAGEQGSDRPLWRISTAPSRAAAFAAMIADQGTADLFYDWAGGLIWFLGEPSDDAGAGRIRRATAAFDGHATLIRAPAALRATIDVFEPQDPSLAALTRRVKDSFDPKGVFNRGRMWAGV